MTFVDHLCVCMCLSVPGFIWTEIKQMWDNGFQDYIDDWWNLMDFIMNALYLATISLKIVAYSKVRNMLDGKVSYCLLNDKNTQIYSIYQRLQHF